jgi:hypothetical protein
MQREPSRVWWRLSAFPRYHTQNLDLRGFLLYIFGQLRRRNLIISAAITALPLRIGNHFQQEPYA